MGIIELCGLVQELRKCIARHVVASAVLAIAALYLVGCGDPTAELLEGMATRVASDGETPLHYEAELCVNEARIRVLVADTPEERVAGLGGYADLPEDAGMLFVLPEPTQPTFWMKGMNFAIDIIWIHDGVVVQIHDSVPLPPRNSPDDQLPRYRPDEPITHVLELTAGSAERLGITIGSRLEYCPDDGN